MFVAVVVLEFEDGAPGEVHKLCEGDLETCQEAAKKLSGWMYRGHRKVRRGECYSTVLARSAWDDLEDVVQVNAKGGAA
jgi:hypothetical protein